MENKEDIETLLANPIQALMEAGWKDLIRTQPIMPTEEQKLIYMSLSDVDAAYFASLVLKAPEYPAGVWRMLCEMMAQQAVKAGLTDPIGSSADIH